MLILVKKTGYFMRDRGNAKNKAKKTQTNKRKTPNGNIRTKKIKIFVIKNSMDEINSKLETTEEKVIKLHSRQIEISQS